MQRVAKQSNSVNQLQAATPNTAATTIPSVALNETLIEVASILLAVTLYNQTKQSDDAKVTTPMHPDAIAPTQPTVEAATM